VHAGVKGNKTAAELARSDSVQRFVGPEHFLGAFRQNIRTMVKCWMERHLASWR